MPAGGKRIGAGRKPGVVGAAKRALADMAQDHADLAHHDRPLVAAPLGGWNHWRNDRPFMPWENSPPDGFLDLCIRSDRWDGAVCCGHDDRGSHSTCIRAPPAKEVAREI